MNDTRLKMIELSARGLHCSQIILMLGLNEKNDKILPLIRAVDGLAYGCGEGSCTCGALTGGCCLMSLLIDNDISNGIFQSNKQKMISELVNWFWQKYGFPYGGIDCMAITEAEAFEPRDKRCWIIIEDIYDKIRGILNANGYNLNDRKHYSN